MIAGKCNGVINFTNGMGVITPVGSVGRASDSRFFARVYNGIIDFIKIERIIGLNKPVLTRSTLPSGHYAIYHHCATWTFVTSFNNQRWLTWQFTDYIQHVLAYKMFHPGSILIDPHFFNFHTIHAVSFYPIHSNFHDWFYILGTVLGKSADTNGTDQVEPTTPVVVCLTRQGLLLLPIGMAFGIGLDCKHELEPTG